MISLATLGREAGYIDAMLGRRPSSADRYLESHIGEDFGVFAAAYYQSYREVRANQINEGKL